MNWAVKRIIQRLLLGSLCFPALILGLQGCMESGEGSLSKRNAQKLIELMAQTDISLASDDAAARLAHFSSLAKTKPGQGSSYMEGDVSGLLQIDWSLRGQALEVAAEVMFSDADDVQDFRERLNKAFGAPDAACSNSALTHWLPQEGLSVRFQTESEQEDGSGQWFGALSVMNGDPVDVNCARSSSDKAQIMDVATLKALFLRIKTSPPPLQQADAMQTWLQTYGDVTPASTQRCMASMYNHTPSEPTGFHNLYAEINTCPGGITSHMRLESTVQDMFASQRVRDTAEEVFGYSLLPCSHAHRDVWEVSPQQTLVASYIADQVALELYDGPASVVKNCR